MKKLLGPLVALLIATGICSTSVAVFYAGRADAQPVLVDAGVTTALDAGSALAGSGSAVEPTKPSDTIDDPIENPSEYISDVRLAKKTGWALAVLVVLFGICKLLGRAKTIAWLAWLGRGKAALIIGASGAVIAALIDTIALGGTLVAAGYAAVLALFGYLDLGDKKSSSQSTPPTS